MVETQTISDEKKILLRCFICAFRPENHIKMRQNRGKNLNWLAAQETNLHHTIFTYECDKTLPWGLIQSKTIEIIWIYSYIYLSEYFHLSSEYCIWILFLQKRKMHFLRSWVWIRGRMYRFRPPEYWGDNMRKWCNEKSANFLNVKKTLNSSVKYITSKKSVRIKVRIKMDMKKR